MGRHVVRRERRSSGNGRGTPREPGRATRSSTSHGARAPDARRARGARQGELQQAPKRRAALLRLDELIAKTARQIRDLHRASGLQFASDVGRIVVDRFYGGDVSLLRDRGPKDASLRKLAEHPELPLSASALYQAIGIFELLERHGGVHTCKHLGPSHLRLLLGLPETTQAKLLRRAEQKRWTVQDLAQASSGAREPKGKGGRPRLPAFVKTIRAMRRFVQQPEIYFGGVDDVEALQAQDREELCEVVRQLRARCDELEARLGERSGKKGASDSTSLRISSAPDRRGSDSLG